VEALHLTNNFILAKPADIRDPNKNPDQWIIMPFLNYYFQNTQNQQSRVFKIGRSYNKVAHRQAKEAHRLHDVGRNLSFFLLRS
jgi:hypothetical protein